MSRRGAASGLEGGGSQQQWSLPTYWHRGKASSGPLWQRLLPFGLLPLPAMLKSNPADPCPDPKQPHQSVKCLPRPHLRWDHKGRLRSSHVPWHEMPRLTRGSPLLVLLCNRARCPRRPPFALQTSSLGGLQPHGSCNIIRESEIFGSIRTSHLPAVALPCISLPHHPVSVGPACGRRGRSEIPTSFPRQSFGCSGLACSSLCRTRRGSACIFGP